MRHTEIAPDRVHETLRRHLLVDGYPIVVDLEHSHGSWLKDRVTGKDYLDFFSFFASNPIGFNHPSMLGDDIQERLARAATTKVSNSDYYSVYMAEFVEMLEKTAAPPDFPHYFFIDGGALAVENAMKAAFDWKTKKNQAAGRAKAGSQILHLDRAFHGRSGYTLSVTNTDPVKTDHFPKFDWPRIPSPAIRFPLERHLGATLELEDHALLAAERAFEVRGHEIAGILLEPIQGEGGDNHFRPEFFSRLRRLADDHEALLIYDEVQTGLGLTGHWWAYQHHEVAPDIICFAKKMQVGGIMCNRRIDEVPDNVFARSSRINSTWGASLVDMVRCTKILETIVNERLLDNVIVRGRELLSELETLQDRYANLVSNARGAGLMCAVDLPSTELRNNVVRWCFEDQMIVLPCGPRSVRFRPTLSVQPEVLAEGLQRFQRALDRASASSP